MRIPFPSFLGSAVVIALMAFGQPMSLQAASGQDSAPVLLSREGGKGSSWTNIRELEQAATKGDLQAEATLGDLLLRGAEGLAKNEVRAVALLEKAARAGHAGAAFRIGMLLSRGEHGVALDQERALAYFRAAAAGGEAEAFFNIGAAHASARGVKRDYAEALGWLIVARQRGVGADTEAALRAQIKSRATWIATGERRAREIEASFAGKTVPDFLPPPAPLDTAVDPLKPVLPLRR